MNTPSKRCGYVLATLAVMVWTSLVSSSMRAQTTSNQASSSRVERTEILSYEGQNVSSVELAGRPDLRPDQFQSLLLQRSGQPFSATNVDQTLAALKATGQFQDVTLDLRPEGSGVRVIFVAQPAYYFGMYDFKGAHGFTY